MNRNIFPSGLDLDILRFIKFNVQSEHLIKPVHFFFKIERIFLKVILALEFNFNNVQFYDFSGSSLFGEIIFPNDSTDMNSKKYAVCA